MTQSTPLATRHVSTIISWYILCRWLIAAFLFAYSVGVLFFHRITGGLPDWTLGIPLSAALVTGSWLLIANAVVYYFRAPAKIASHFSPAMGNASGVAPPGSTTESTSLSSRLAGDADDSPKKCELVSARTLTIRNPESGIHEESRISYYASIGQQIIIDWLALSMLILMTGTERSMELVYAFLAHGVLCANVLRRHAALLYIILSVILVIGLAIWLILMRRCNPTTTGSRGISRNAHATQPHCRASTHTSPSWKQLPASN